MPVNPQLSPIVIFVYNRLDFIKTTIKYLKKNNLSSKSDLFIYSDASIDNKFDVGVKDVRNYISSIQGFGSCTIIERNKNFGLAKNIIEGVTEIIHKYGTVIVLEDDLITSKNFLCYMNQALNFYEHKNHIFSISAYTSDLHSLKDLKEDAYLSFRPSSWGWATWKDQWDNIDWNVTDFENFIKNKKKKKKFNRGGIDMTRMLKHYIDGKNHSWAIRWSYAMYKQDKYSIYPKLSKIQNIGFDKRATHCKGVNIYKTKLDHSEQCDFIFTDDKIPHYQISRDFKYQYSYTNKLIKKIKGYIEGFKNET